MKDFDVVIVGTGPASIFTALTLVKRGITNIALFEKGKSLSQRDRKQDMLFGWGGAGAFSDGKLILSNEIGGWLSEFVPPSELSDLIKEVDLVYLSFGASESVVGDSTNELEELHSMAKLSGLEFIPTRVRHLGTENCSLVLERMREELKDVPVYFETPVNELVVKDGKVIGVDIGDEEFKAEYVVCGPGRSGAEWMRQESGRIGLSFRNNPVDIGVRIEVPWETFGHVTNISHDAKFVYYSNTFDDRVRTFCVNPYGEVVMEKVNGMSTVNGHSYKERKTSNTNFAILVSIPFTEPPFKDPISYGKHIASLSNLLSHGVIVQRLGDFLDGRRSTAERIGKSIVKPTLTSATPGDLSLALPYRYMKDIVEMLESLDKVAPGVFSKNTLLYGIEVKFYTNRIKVSSVMESEIRNLFLIGDGAGITRGLVQASVTGIIAANEIVRRMT